MSSSEEILVDVLLVDEGPPIDLRRILTLL